MEKVYNSLEKYYKLSDIIIFKKYNSKKYFIEFLRHNHLTHSTIDLSYIVQQMILKEMKESRSRYATHTMNVFKYETL